MSNVINLADHKLKAAKDDRTTARTLAKKIVAAYHEHGEEGYYNAIASATRGNKEFLDFLAPFIEEEIAKPYLP